VTGELWMCLVLVALLLVAISQNLGLRDRLKQMESRLDLSQIVALGLAGLSRVKIAIVAQAALFFATSRPMR
jgi:hypothetical protein